MVSHGRAGVHRVDCDGVPTLWATAPGSFVGALVFRVGQVDESLAERGWTHLVEHLVLSDDRIPSGLDVNGSVGPSLTTFIASGEPDAVGEFLSQVSLVLGSVSGQRLAKEVQILRVEEARRGGPLTAAYSVRYGAMGHGRLALPELGLHRATPERVQAWATLRFNRQSAAVWLSGPPPPTLDLAALSDGRYRPPVETTPVDGRSFPCWQPGPSGNFTVMMPVERTVEAMVAMRATGAQLRRRLRDEEGRSYAVSVELEPVTAESSHVVITADCLPNDAGAVQDVLVSELARISLEGPSQDHVDDVVSAARRMTALPESAVAAVESAVFDLLFRADPAASDLAAVEELDGKLLAASIQRAWRQSVWIVPHQLAMTDRRFHRATHVGPVTLDGQRHTAVSGDGTAIVVGRAGIAIVGEGGRGVQVEHEHVAALGRWSDGALTVWAEDGAVLDLVPSMWVGGMDAADIVQSSVSPDLVVEMGEPLNSSPVLAVPEAATSRETGSAATNRKLPPARPSGARPSTGAGVWLLDATLGSIGVVALLSSIGYAGAHDDQQWMQKSILWGLVGIALCTLLAWRIMSARERSRSVGSPSVGS